MYKQTQIKSDILLPEKFKELLTDNFPTLNFDNDNNLSKEQEKAFNIFKSGESIAIVGSAGVGKSKLIKTIENYVKINTNKKIAVCATTGIAAYNINGLTIHSFMGIGSGDGDINYIIKKVYRKKMIRERIISTDIIILDEVSMLSAELFEKLNILCQCIRNNKLFFGGIQLVLSFDPLQLLPVFNKNKDIYKELDERLIIESPVFNKNFIKNKNIILLTENFRQNDSKFVELLLRIRNGSFTDSDIDILKKRLNYDKTYKSIYLVSSNKKAQDINKYNLDILTGEIFSSNVSYEKTDDTEMSKLLIKELQFQFRQKGIDSLNLKVGCRVMLIKNLDVSIGLVNGAFGTIKKINNGVIDVEFDNGIIHPITSVSWKLEYNNISVTAKQIPLMLAYGVTIHKSQSVTLDSAILDLSDCFTEHQVYTALSRLRSLDGLYLKSFDPTKIKVNQKMKKFIDNLS